MNRSFSLRRLLSRRLFQVALLGLPATSFLLAACVQETSGTGSTTTTGTGTTMTTTTTTTTGSGGGGGGGGAGSGGAGSGGVGGGVGGQVANPPCGVSFSSGTGSTVHVGTPCFPWPAPGATGAGGGGGSMALPCPAPDMAPASWELEKLIMEDKRMFVAGPSSVEPTAGMCCYELLIFCQP